MKEMVGGCCVCSDESGWDENPLVYCDGQQCSVAVHKACYGIVQVPSGPWFCRKCESQERLARVRCELCPSRDGALKRTDNGGWAHVVCSLYIPEVRFGDVKTMEPIVLQYVPSERYHKTCYICEERGRESKSKVGACMQCNKIGCKQYFHVTCAQSAGLLCEEAGKLGDNVKFCGYCKNHYQKIKEDNNIKTIPAFKPAPVNEADSSLDKRSSSYQAHAESGRPVKKKQKLVNSSGSSSANNRQSSSTHLTEGEKKKRKTSNGSKEKDRLVAATTTTTTSHPSTTKSTTTKETSKPRPFSLSSSSSSSLSEGSNGSSSSTTVDSPPSSPSIFKSIYSSLSDSKDSKSSKSKPKEKSTSFTRNSRVFDSSSDSEGEIRPPAKKSKVTVEKKRQRKPSLTQSAAKEKSNNEKEKEFSKKLKKKRDEYQDEFDRVFAQQKIEPRSDLESRSQNGSIRNRKTSLIGLNEKVEIESTGAHVENRPVSPVMKATSNTKELLSTNSKVTSKSHGAKSEIISHTTKEAVGTASNAAMTVINGNETSVLPSETGLKLPLSISVQDSAEHSSKSLDIPCVSNNFVLPLAKKQPMIAEFKDPDPPRSLEQLLERQWTQTAQFLMDQPQHFDIASLLSCLNQLRSDNEKLEDRVRQLLARRDHLIAVNSRLSVSLNGLAAPSTSSVGSFPSVTTPTLSQFGSNHSSSTSVTTGNSIPSAINGNSNFFNAAANLLTNNGISNTPNLASVKHSSGMNGNGTFYELNNNNTISGEKTVSNGTTTPGCASVPPTNGSFHFANSIAHNLSQFGVSGQPTISFPASSINSNSLTNSHTSSPLNNVNCSSNNLVTTPSLFQSLFSQQSQQFGLSASQASSQRTHSKR